MGWKSIMRKDISVSEPLPPSWSSIFLPCAHSSWSSSWAWSVPRRRAAGGGCPPHPRRGRPVRRSSFNKTNRTWCTFYLSIKLKEIRIKLLRCNRGGGVKKGYYYTSPYLLLINKETEVLGMYLFDWWVPDSQRWNSNLGQCSCVRSDREIGKK